MLDGSHFLNRELSWLEFNRRVLATAASSAVPLLERVRFLSIFTSNLDEFFMIRLAALRQRVLAGVVSPATDGLTPPEHMTSARRIITELLKDQANCFEQEIKPALLRNGIAILSWEELTEEERAFAHNHFQKNLFPILTPQAVDPGRPFPAISSLSYSLGVVLTEPEKEEKLFARVKIPQVKPQLLRLASADPSTYRFISIAEVIKHNVPSLFHGMSVQAIMPFRITRDADLTLDEEEADDLLELVKEELRERRFARAVRLETGSDPDPWALEFLLRELELTREDLYPMHRVDFRTIQELAELPIPHLHYDVWAPTTPPAFSEEETSPFNVLTRGDVLVHHPYESFSASIERFLRAAVEDPKVLSIKITLYRTGDKSTLIPLLIKAAELNKQVVCLIELKANFDEANNIRFAEALEAAGVYVMYGVVGLKTHAKVILIAREERDEVRCYAHIGTGNYNPQTARVYTDLGLFTCNREVCEDLTKLFHYLTGRAVNPQFTDLLVAPFNMRERFMDLIAREVEHAVNGRPARIFAKMNSLEDQAICNALLRAAQAGVEVKMIVRGLSCLKPVNFDRGQRIEVISVLGRYLEHSRIFYFANGESDPLKGDYYLGSADWMHRNLSKRVEVVVPVRDSQARTRLMHIFEVMLDPKNQCWQQQPDGAYILRRETSDSQEILMQHARDMAQASRMLKS